MAELPNTLCKYVNTLFKSDFSLICLSFKASFVLTHGFLGLYTNYFPENLMAVKQADKR